MKSVLIAIQPYWVFLIIAKKMGWEIDQEKTVEVRKSFPKDLNWNKKSIIYCGKNKQSFNRIPKKYQPLMEKFLGKVIGEFVCDRIDDFYYELSKGFYEPREFLWGSCLSLEQVKDYVGGSLGYAWHITDLIIYAKPKELWEFKTKCNEYGSENPNCTECKYYISGMCYEYDESDCGCNGLKPITRPPQSWCYVEELGV